MYSRFIRTGTPAARMEDQIDEEVKHARVHELIELSEKMQLEYAQKFVGQVLDVIPERDEKGLFGKGHIGGFSDNYLQIRFEGSDDLIGELCRVKVTKAGVNTSEGQLVRVLDQTTQALA